MKLSNVILFTSVFCALSQADDAVLKMGFENFTFENSKKKDAGKRYLAGVDYHYEETLFQALYSRTDTDTFQPPLNDDLHVNKLYLKATHRLDEKQAFNLNYITLNDNLMDEVDGGNIYGIGYRYKNLHLNQYLSDYRHFNAYQTDVKYTYKKAFGTLKTTWIGMGKYIHLDDRESNPFSKNAQEDYFTAGVKIHADYEKYHIGVGGFFGKRAFAVMFDGFRVQHHAMEFNRTYMIGLGRKFGAIDLKFKYIHQKATELPINNHNVKVQNFILQLNYRF